MPPGLEHVTSSSLSSLPDCIAVVHALGLKEVPIVSTRQRGEPASCSRRSESADELAQAETVGARSTRRHCTPRLRCSRRRTIGASCTTKAIHSGHCDRRVHQAEKRIRTASVSPHHRRHGSHRAPCFQTKNRLFRFRRLSWWLSRLRCQSSYCEHDRSATTRRIAVSSSRNSLQPRSRPPALLLLPSALLDSALSVSLCSARSAARAAAPP